MLDYGFTKKGLGFVGKSDFMDWDFHPKFRI